MVVSAAAADLGISRVTLWRYIKAGRLKAERVGPLFVIEREALEAFKAKPRPVGRPRARPA